MLSSGTARNLVRRNFAATALLEAAEVASGASTGVQSARLPYPKHISFEANGGGPLRLASQRAPGLKK